MTQIKLQRVQETDLTWLLDLRQEDNWMHHITPVSLETQKQWYASLATATPFPRQWCFCGYQQHDALRSNIGYFYFQNIDWINRKADVSWALRKEFRGEGMGKKLVAAGRDFAKDYLNLRRLDAEILSPNKPSRACAEAAGFVHEGTKRKAVVRHGEAYDSLVFGLLFD